MAHQILFVVQVTANDGAVYQGIVNGELNDELTHLAVSLQGDTLPDPMIKAIVADKFATEVARVSGEAILGCTRQVAQRLMVPPTPPVAPSPAVDAPLSPDAAPGDIPADEAANPELTIKPRNKR